MQQSSDIKLSDVLQYELAPVPASMFAENREMRIAKKKATLKKNLQVETPSRLTPQPDVTIIDGCAILCVIHWPNRGTVRDFVDSFTSFIFGKVERCDIYLVFDRYHDFGIQNGTRLARAGHKLSLQTPLPLQKVILNVTENKVQLIKIICHHFIAASQQGKPTNHSPSIFPDGDSSRVAKAS